VPSPGELGSSYFRVARRSKRGIRKSETASKQSSARLCAEICGTCAKEAGKRNDMTEILDEVKGDIESETAMGRRAGLTRNCGRLTRGERALESREIPESLCGFVLEGVVGERVRRKICPGFSSRDEAGRGCRAGKERLMAKC
jgi:hypothetical protein